jgi:hypothetical protein
MPRTRAAVKRGPYDKHSAQQFKVLLQAYNEGQSIHTACQLSGIKLKTGEHFIRHHQLDPEYTAPKARGGKRHVKFNKDEVGKTVLLLACFHAYSDIRSPH